MSTTPSLTAQVSAQLSKNVPKSVGVASLDAPTTDDRMRVLLYGYTSSRKTTTAAMFGGPDRTLIISTRDVEQVRIPLRGLGFKPIITAYEPDALMWALQFPEKAADAVGFPEWKDQEQRVLVVDDWTEGAQLLVEENSTTDSGVEVKDGRKIYGGVKEDVRDVLNTLKKKHIHQVFTALADENDWAVYPALPKGARRGLEASFDYVFYMDGDNFKMKTLPFSVPYPAKDQFGKDVTRLRKGFAKRKEGMGAKVLLAEEPMDLRLIWQKIAGAGAGAGK